MVSSRCFGSSQGIQTEGDPGNIRKIEARVASFLDRLRLLTRDCSDNCLADRARRGGDHQWQQLVFYIDLISAHNCDYFGYSRFCSFFRRLERHQRDEKRERGSKFADIRRMSVAGIKEVLRASDVVRKVFSNIRDPGDAFRERVLSN